MSTITEIRDGVGASVQRPDGIPKVKGELAYSSDMWADGMLWGATLRLPHPRACIRGIDISKALAVRGMHAVLTHEDVPGRKTLDSSITTSRCWRSPRSATRASRWRSSPPITESARWAASC